MVGCEPLALPVLLETGPPLARGRRARVKLYPRPSPSAGRHGCAGGSTRGGSERPDAVYGYKVVDGGPHSNPRKAEEGYRLRVLVIDESAAEAVRRIFSEYLAGLGDRAIANGSTGTASRVPRRGGRSRTLTGWLMGGRAARCGPFGEPALYRVRDLRAVDQAGDLA